MVWFRKDKSKGMSIFVFTRKVDLGKAGRNGKQKAWKDEKCKRKRKRENKEEEERE